ncbi:MAG: 2-dehydro-3-deoxygalactonokinase [Pseudomonadota bacterium]
MGSRHYIAGDWGTSNLRVYLCEVSDNTLARVIEVKSGLGIAAIAKLENTDFETEFFALAQDWLAQYEIDAIVLSGMVGSNIGWFEAPYASCPADAKSIRAGITQFSARGEDIHLVSGLKCNNPIGQFDVMRGEELQLLGWLLQHGDSTGQRLFALPGTHNKWVLVEGGTISTFMTTFTGELFGLLADHSVLVPPADRTTSVDWQSFDAAVSIAQHEQTHDIVQTLFSTRARQIEGKLSLQHAKDYLSGLIITADVSSALKSFAQYGQFEEIVLIGETRLCEQYQRVLAQVSSCKVTHCLPTDIAAFGYQAIYQEL